MQTGCLLLLLLLILVAGQTGQSQKSKDDWIKAARRSWHVPNLFPREVSVLLACFIVEDMGSLEPAACMLFVQPPLLFISQPPEAKRLGKVPETTVV